MLLFLVPDIPPRTMSGVSFRRIFPLAFTAVTIVVRADTWRGTAENRDELPVMLTFMGIGKPGPPS